MANNFITLLKKFIRQHLEKDITIELEFETISSAIQIKLFIIKIEKKERKQQKLEHRLKKQVSNLSIKIYFMLLVRLQQNVIIHFQKF